MTPSLPADPPAAPPRPVQPRPAETRPAQPRPHRAGSGPSRSGASRSGMSRPAPPDGSALDARTPPQPVRIGSPAALLAVIPGLLGFDPGDSIVVVGTAALDEPVRLTLRYDAPDASRPESAAALARHAVSVLAAQGVTSAAVVGYGTDAVVAPVAAALRARAAAAGITITESLRVTGGRYWSYVCADPACCRPEGTPFDPAAHPAARALAAAGGTVLADRRELAATIAPADGQRAAAMRRATGRALAQVSRITARLERAGTRVPGHRLTAAVGQVAVRDAISQSRAGKLPGTELAAWLTVALREVRVRDDAWAHMDPAHQGAHLRLWAHLTRLARPGYVAAPAALLAFVAWQSGDGALANVALDRALADSPRYSMAVLLREALDSGAPPSMARLPMTPEEVAEAYDEADAARASASRPSAGRAGAGRSGKAARR
jgi:Domain of unknown function (DUF4192)